jgi:CHASE3 domain sensor protein
MPKALLLLVVAAILLGNGFVIYTISAHRNATFQELRDQQVLDEVESVQALLVDAETGQRGYILTGKREYLAPFVAAEEKVLPAIAALETHLRSLGADTTSVNDLRDHATAKLNELRQTIALFESGQTAQAREVIASGSGKAEMDAVRSVVADIRTTELQRSEATRRRWEYLLDWLYGCIFVFSILALVATLVLIREVMRRSALSARVETVNEIAHELNNPLQTTTNLFTILKRKDTLPKDIQEFLQTLESEHNRIVSLSRRLLRGTRP